MKNGANSCRNLVKGCASKPSPKAGSSISHKIPEDRIPVYPVRLAHQVAAVQILPEQLVISHRGRAQVGGRPVGVQQPGDVDYFPDDLGAPFDAGNTALSTSWRRVPLNRSLRPFSVGEHE